MTTTQTDAIMALADRYAFHIPGSQHSDEARAALLEALQAREGEAVDYENHHALWMQISGGDYEAWPSVEEFAKRLTAPQPAQLEKWCKKMNGCAGKCDDCPDEAPQPAQPEQGEPAEKKHPFVLWGEYESRIESLTNEVVFHKGLTAKALMTPPVTQEITRLKSIIEDMELAAAALQSAQPVALPMTPERILHLVDIHVGSPSPKYPLDNSDWISFGRAIEYELRTLRALKPLTPAQRVDIADACRKLSFEDDYLGDIGKVIDLTEAAHGIGEKL